MENLDLPAKLSDSQSLLVPIPHFNWSKAQTTTNTVTLKVSEYDWMEKWTINFAYQITGFQL